MGADVDTLHGLFAGLWSDYVAFNPEAKKIHDLIFDRERRAHPSGTGLVNDHIALRTFDLPKIGVEALGALIAPLGYRPAGEYHFAEKKLYARHFEHSEENNPKIFISELQVAKLSPLVGRIAREAAEACPAPVDPSFFWSGRHWEAEHATYLELLKESEYAAWMYAFGFRCNHFTIHVNHLKSFGGLVEVNEFVKAAGFALNTSGGEIKGSPEVLLEQSSTLASKTRVAFVDGTFEIPSTYYEFALRHRLPDGRFYQGFVAASADKIFESTDTRR